MQNKIINAMDIYKQATWLEMITCNWMKPIIEYTQENDLSPSSLGQIPTKDSSQCQGSKLSQFWEIYKNSGKYPLLRSVFWTYRYEIGLSLLC